MPLAERLPVGGIGAGRSSRGGNDLPGGRVGRVFELGAPGRADFQLLVVGAWGGEGGGAAVGPAGPGDELADAPGRALPGRGHRGVALVAVGVSVEYDVGAP